MNALAATTLLNRIESDITVREFNNALVDAGYLEIRNRESTVNKGVFKKYKAFTDIGLAYGNNMKTIYHDEQTIPVFYEERFIELYNNVIEILDEESLSKAC